MLIQLSEQAKKKFLALQEQAVKEALWFVDQAIADPEDWETSFLGTSRK